MVFSLILVHFTTVGADSRAIGRMVTIATGSREECPTLAAAITLLGSLMTVLLDATNARVAGVSVPTPLGTRLRRLCGISEIGKIGGWCWQCTLGQGSRPQHILGLPGIIPGPVDQTLTAIRHMDHPRLAHVVDLGVLGNIGPENVMGVFHAIL